MCWDFLIICWYRQRPEQILTNTKVTAAKVIHNVSVNQQTITRCRNFWHWFFQLFYKMLLQTACTVYVRNMYKTNWTVKQLMDLFSWITLLCSGPSCVSFVQPMYVCLYHITQFFPQQGRLRGPAKPRMPTTAPHFFVFMKKLQLRGGVEGRTQENVVHLGSYG